MECCNLWLFKNNVSDLYSNTNKGIRLPNFLSPKKLKNNASSNICQGVDQTVLDCIQTKNKLCLGTLHCWARTITLLDGSGNRCLCSEAL